MLEECFRLKVYYLEEISLWVMEEKVVELLCVMVDLEVRSKRIICYSNLGYIDFRELGLWIKKTNRFYNS